MKIKEFISGFWRKDGRVICNPLSRIHKTGVLLSIVLFSMTLAACSSDKLTGQTSDNGKIQEPVEAKQIIAADGKEVDISKGKIEISMEKAIEIGRKEAEKYYGKLKLTEIHSYDNDYEPSIAAGTEGEREWWYVSFGNEDLNYVVILIQNGEIAAVEKYDKNGNNGLLELSEIQLTSQEAAKRAKGLGLKGGNPDKEEDWVSGYNFKLSYASLVKSPKDIRMFLEVIGISPNENFAHVDFDAATGELLLAEEKIEYQDGTFEWKSFK